MPTQDKESVKGAVAQAQHSVHVRRGTKVASEDVSKDQHLRHSFNILKRWRSQEDGPMEQPRQQKFWAMNGVHLASPIRGELGYAHWPQLGTQFIALLGTKFGAH